MDRDTRIVFLEKQPKFSKITKAVYDNAYMLEIVSTNEPSICSMNQSEDCHCKKGEACADILISDISKSYLSNIDFIEKRIKKGCRVKYHAILTDTWSDTQLKRIKKNHEIIITVIENPASPHVCLWTYYLSSIYSIHDPF